MNIWQCLHPLCDDRNPVTVSSCGRRHLAQKYLPIVSIISSNQKTKKYTNSSLISTSSPLPLAEWIADSVTTVSNHVILPSQSPPLKVGSVPHSKRVSLMFFDKIYTKAARGNYAQRALPACVRWAAVRSQLSSIYFFFSRFRATLHHSTRARMINTFRSSVLSHDTDGGLLCDERRETASNRPGWRGVPLRFIFIVVNLLAMLRRRNPVIAGDVQMVQIVFTLQLR